MDKHAYRLFDEAHTRIFGRPEVTAGRILALHDVFETVLENVEKIDNKLLAGYTLTKFFLIFLIREALETESLGKEFCQHPADFMDHPHGRTRLRHCIEGILIEGILNDLIIELNAEVKEREDKGTPFDYKRDFKSPNPTRSIARALVPQYQRLISRGLTPSFGDEWKTSLEKLSST